MKKQSICWRSPVFGMIRVRVRVRPLGKDIAAALDFMLALGEKSGFRTKNVDGYAGHVEYGEGEELIGVLSHLDVVPPGMGGVPSF